MMRIASASSTRWARLAPRRRRVTREEIKGSSGQWVLASETRYVYDGMRVIQERTSNGVPTVAYTRGPDLSGTLEGAGGIGGLLARSEWNSVSSTWSHAFYHSDGVGNVTALAVPSGNDIALAGSYRYDPFGRLIGTPTDLAARNTQRFSSKDWHNASGFYYFGYRFYDPATQRWLNRDPIGEEGGVNLYGYVGNNPVGAIDPEGASPTLVTGAIGAGIGALVGGGITAWNGGSWSEIGMSAGRGAIAGGVAGLTMGIGGGAVAGVFGGGVLGGVASGAVAGAAGNVAAQGFDFATGSRCKFGWGELGVSAGTGALFGGAFARPWTAPNQQITSWAPSGFTPNLDPGRWVMTGGPSLGNYARTVGPAVRGYPYDNSATSTVPGSTLSYPPGTTGNMAGILGQRVVNP
jgi:RHS repeat-associated protein